MVLTDKAKEDFLKTKICSEVILFESMLPIYQHSLIAEWFSTKTEIDIEYILSLALEEMSYTDALIKSIKKANEMYNKINK